MDIFRAEAIEAKKSQYWGVARLHAPLSFTWICAFCFVLGAALVAFITWGEFNRKAQLTGLLMPSVGSMGILAPQAGMLLNLPVHEGLQVKAGQVLLSLYTEHRSLRNGVADDTNERTRQQIALRRQTLSTERNLHALANRQSEQVMSQRIDTLQAEHRQAEAELDLQTRRAKLAELTLARDSSLAKEGFLSEAQVQIRQEELIDAQAKLAALSRTLLALQHDIQTLNGERKALVIQLQKDVSQIDRSLASNLQEDIENTTRQNVVLTAPFDGTVTALNLQPGQFVVQGQTLLTLVPTGTGQRPISTADGIKTDTGLQAQLFAPSKTIGFVKPGQTVFLRYDAYPFEKFGIHRGSIRSVSTTPFAPSELPQNLSQSLLERVGSNEALYRINVTLDHQSIDAYGERLPLRPGLTLQADVLQERRKVWEWALSPILAARQHIKVFTMDPQGSAGEVGSASTPAH